MIHVFVLVMLIIWMSALYLHLRGTQKALSHFRKCPPFLDAPFGLYPVSVLKPVKGCDSELRKNLTTFFELDYPLFELIFSVADEDDEALPVIEALIKKHPKVQARVIIGAVDCGPNPKVNNLIKSYDEARFDWCLISDANVRVEKNYLKRLVAHVDSNTGVVTAVVAGRDPRSLGGRLEATYLNTFYARWMILADHFGRSCVVGKSMLFRKSDAERFGGIKTLARYLAEDYMAGEAMKLLGLKVVTMVDPIVQPIGEYSFESFWSRHLRWGRIRKSQAGGLFLMEPLLGPIVSGVFGAYSVSLFLGVPAILVGVVHWVVWCLADLKLMARLEGRAQGMSDLCYWSLREALHLPLWLQTLSGNTVRWRGQRLRVLPGGILDQEC